MFEVIIWLLLIEDNRIFLLEKKTDKYHEFGLPGGKLKIGESIKQGIIREVGEEIGIEVLIEDLIFRCVIDRKRPDTQKIHFIFQTEKYKGEPYNRELHKHISANWYNLNNLPIKLCPVAKSAIESLQTETNYDEIGW